MARSIDSISKQVKAGDTPAPEEPKAETTPAEEVKAEEPKVEEAKVEEPKAEEAKAEEPKEEAKPEEPKAEETKPAEDPKAEPAAADAAPATEGATPAADSFETMFPEPSVVVSGPPAWIWWLLLFLGAGALAFLAFDLTRGKIDSWIKTSSESPAATATPEASASPSAEASPSAAATTTPTPSPSSSTSGVVKSSITIRVLNGTTTSGAAGTTKTTLEKAGFTVRAVGNAKNQNYTKTTIYYQTGKKAEAEAVQSALPAGSVLEESSTQANPDMVLVVYGS